MPGLEFQHLNVNSQTKSKTFLSTFEKTAESFLADAELCIFERCAAFGSECSSMYNQILVLSRKIPVVTLTNFKSIYF